MRVSLLQRLTTFLRSPLFFWIIIGFFVVEALWMVFSALYPMAFDEDFHMGVIKIYAQQWSPFLTSQPVGADSFGALARDPSYLYHYLMSFPYRLCMSLFNSETATIIILRLVNVALFTYALLLFRRVLLGATSPLVVNTSLALFVLIPIVPQLAAHVNYDNLIMVIVAWTALLMQRFISEAQHKKIHASTVLWLGNIGLLACLVKYAYLPIFAATVLSMLYIAWRSMRGIPLKAIAAKHLVGLRRYALVGGALLTIVSGGLFFQRFGVNVITYGEPVADCGDVLAVEQCVQYGPWGRNYYLAQSKAESNESPLLYTGQWLWGLWLRLFFAVSGATNDFANYPPLPVPYYTMAALAISSVLLIIVFARKVFAGQLFVQWAALAIFLYSAALWLDDYQQFVETGQPVAINGRYLLPIMLLGMLIAARAWGALLARRQVVKVSLAALAIVLFLQGGGIMTFIVRSDPGWYWHNSVVLHVNNTAKKVLSPLLIEGTDHY